MTWRNYFDNYLAGTFFMQTGVNPGLPAEDLPPKQPTGLEILNSPAVLLALGLTAFYLITKK